MFLSPKCTLTNGKRNSLKLKYVKGFWENETNSRAQKKQEEVAAERKALFCGIYGQVQLDDFSFWRIFPSVQSNLPVPEASVRFAPTKNTEFFLCPQRWILPPNAVRKNRGFVWKFNFWFRFRP